MAAPSLNPTAVEEFAQKLFHYEKIMQLHLAELRKDPEILQATHDLVHKSSTEDPNAIPWPPKPHEHDAYLKHMDDICSKPPSTYKDHMEIVLASHSASTCYMLFYINGLPENIHEKVMGRYRVLSQVFALELMSTQENRMNPQYNLSGSVSPARALNDHYTAPSHISGRLLTIEEKASYAVNPLALIGRHFILDADSTYPLPFKVVGVKISEGPTIIEVFFAGCSCAEALEYKEVMDMIDGSTFLSI